MIITCYCEKKIINLRKRGNVFEFSETFSGKEYMTWKTAFGYLPVNYNTVIGTLENITQRTCFKNNLKGNKIKLRFSNKYGKEPLVLDEVILGNSRDGKIMDAVKVTYEQKEKIMLLPGEEFYSDEIAFCCEPGTDLAASIYIQNKTDVMSACCASSGQCWYSRYETDSRNLTEGLRNSLESKDIFSCAESEILVGICEIQVLQRKKYVRCVCLEIPSPTCLLFRGTDRCAL